MLPLTGQERGRCKRGERCGWLIGRIKAPDKVVKADMLVKPAAGGTGVVARKRSRQLDIPLKPAGHAGIMVRAARRTVTPPMSWGGGLSVSSRGGNWGGQRCVEGGRRRLSGGVVGPMRATSIVHQQRDGKLELYAKQK